MSKLKIAQSIQKNGFFTQLPIADHRFDGDILLWRSVLDLALIDLLKGKDHFKEDTSNVQQNELTPYGVSANTSVSSFMGPVTWDGLVTWFSVSSDDFITVCELAGLHPKKVFYRMSEILNE